MSLKAQAQRLLNRSYFYAQSPMIVIGEDGNVEEINAACRVLMGKDIAGCKGHSLDYFLKNVEAKIDNAFINRSGRVLKNLSQSTCNTHILDVDDLELSISECQYHSPNFGLAKLRIFELPCINMVSGKCLGAIFNIEILNIEKKQKFDQAVEKQWRHEIMWEVYANSYDRVLPELFFYQEVLNRHLKEMSNNGIKEVLDVGAGTGNVTIPLLKIGKYVTAVDIGRPMIEKLFSKLENVSCNNLRVIEDTAERLPHLKDHSFDGVTVLLSFFDMQQPHLALQEVERVLKPGGKLVITEPKKCFNVDILMKAAEEALKEKCVYEALYEDWRRIQAVAPIVNETIKMIQNDTSSTGESSAWYAEVIFEILSDHKFLDLTMKDSHLGNCATITGIKPY